MIDYKLVNSYIGKPWVYIENDCWAVVKKASIALFGNEIADIDVPDKPSVEANSEIMKEQVGYPCWELTDKPSSGDVIMFYDNKNNPVHVGLYIEKDNVLHCLGGRLSRNGKTRYDHLSVLKLLYKKQEAYRYVRNDS